MAHSLLMWAHEYVLRTECGYEGAQPYWQEELDAGNFINSIVLDPATGFGGNGTGPGGGIEDGPFVNYTNNIGPGYKVQERCIVRLVNDQVSKGPSQEQVDRCLAMTDWTSAWNCIETRPHNGGHTGVGGQMSNPISSPGDPVFYLHHTWLDKMWWDWQAQDVPTRLTEISGHNRLNLSGPAGGFPGFPGGGELPDLPDDFFPPPVTDGEIPPGFEVRPDDVPDRKLWAMTETRRP